MQLSPFNFFSHKKPSMRSYFRSTPVFDFFNESNELKKTNKLGKLARLADAIKFKKYDYCDDEYCKIPYSALIVYILLAGYVLDRNQGHVADVVTILSYLLGLVLGVKAALAMKPSHVPKGHTIYSIKMVIWAGIFIAYPSIFTPAMGCF